MRAPPDPTRAPTRRFPSLGPVFRPRTPPGAPSGRPSGPPPGRRPRSAGRPGARRPASAGRRATPPCTMTSRIARDSETGSAGGTSSAASPTTAAVPPTSVATTRGTGVQRLLDADRLALPDRARHDDVGGGEQVGHVVAVAEQPHRQLLGVDPGLQRRPQRAVAGDDGQRGRGRRRAARDAASSSRSSPFCGASRATTTASAVCGRRHRGPRARRTGHGSAVRRGGAATTARPVRAGPEPAHPLRRGRPRRRARARCAARDDPFAAPRRRRR